MFAILSTNEEHKKGAYVQLVTAKRMIKSHYETSFTTEKGVDREGGSMTCMFVGNGQGRKYGGSGDASKTDCYCENYGKAGHTAHKDGKPFFRALIAAINGGKGGGGSRNFTGKCHNWNKVGHMKRYRPELKKNNDENDVDNLIIGMIEVEGDDIETNNVKLSSNYIDAFGDTGAQGHVSPPNPHHECGNSHGVVNMTNGATAKMCQKDNCTIEDEAGNEVFLINIRVIECAATPIISLT